MSQSHRSRVARWRASALPKSIPGPKMVQISSLPPFSFLGL
jgi:hypothetical protein